MNEEILIELGAVSEETKGCTGTFFQESINPALFLYSDPEATCD